MVAPRKSLKNIKDEVNYYEHQVTGVREMFKVQSFILADEMGLGKSLSAATVAAIAFQEEKIKRLLIVCPGGLKPNWGEELDERCIFTWDILQGTAAKRRKQLDAFDKQVLIVNYEQLIPHVEQINAMKFDIVIYDEAHMISKFSGFQSDSKYNSQRAAACHKLTAPRHFLLTGSPLTGMIDGLWSLLHRVAPRKFPNYWAFINRYAVYGGYDGKSITGIKNEFELRQKVATVMFRREKKDCLDLPEKMHIPVRLDMHPYQQKLHDEIKYTEQYTNPTTGEVLEVANGMTRVLRRNQVCVTPFLLGDGFEDISVKLDKAQDQCKELIENGHSVVLFTQHRGVIECMERRLDILGIKHYAIHGHVKPEDRMPLVKKWTKETEANKPGVLLCMFQVAGVGLNMTCSSHMIFTDRLYVPKLNEQAEDREHRIGQKNQVTIYVYTIRNSIEQTTEKILKVKAGIFGAIIANEDGKSWKEALIAALKEEEGT